VTRFQCKIRPKFILAVAMFTLPWVAYPQAFATTIEQTSKHKLTAQNSVCDETTTKSAASEALRLACRRKSIAHASFSSASVPVIVIGFVGGFVRADDSHHPEILFASYLRERYDTQIQASVFSNHDAKDALFYVLQRLDANHDGTVSDAERNNAGIIIYGHSWGASEATEFARELGRREIPVLLTVQLDIIAKPGQKPAVIPRNVASAINFYQSEGPLHGRPTIVALDPRVTKILGNIRMEYDRSPVDCGNYNWFVRTFNKPHHEIENDAHVWDRIASLIDAELSGRTVLTNHPAVLRPF
jgi:hypothetical protein